MNSVDVPFFFAGEFILAGDSFAFLPLVFLAGESRSIDIDSSDLLGDFARDFFGGVIGNEDCSELLVLLAGGSAIENDGGVWL